MDHASKIIDFCIKNRVSSTEVADALGKGGVFPNVHPINQNQHVAGLVRCIFTANNSNYAVHEQIRDVKEGDVVIVFTHNCNNRAILGDLVSKYILLYRGAAAIVVQGLVRDVARLRRDGYPIWSEGFSPLGCNNQPAEQYPIDLECKMRSIYDGAVAVCDEGGVTVIPKDMVDNEMLTRLNLIEMQEDIWSFCLNTLKWDTKKIVCDKSYLNDNELLSSVHIDRLNALATFFEDKK